MTRHQFAEAATILDQISNENIRIDEIERMKEISIGKNHYFELGDRYSCRITISKSNCLAVLDAEILLSKAKIETLEHKFASL